MKSSRLIPLLAALLLSIRIASADDGKVLLNFVNAEIESVVTAVGKITKRNFLLDPRVKGKINVVSGQPVPAALTYQILLTALRLQGFAAVDSRGVTVILPEAEAKQHGVPVDGRETPARGDQLTTEVFVLKHESAAQLVPVLRPLVAANNPVTAIPGSNAVVVTDYADNLRRIAQIIDSVDQPSVTGSLVLPVRNSSAVELALTVNRLLNDTPATNSTAEQRVSVVADQTSNRLVLQSQNPARLDQVRRLVESLDGGRGTPGNVHVVYLRNADATKLAQTLRSVVSGDSSATSQASASLSAAAGAAASQPSGGAAAVAPPAGLSGVTGSQVSGGSGTIQADAATNALIITAPDAIFENLRAVIEKLDVKRAQVHIEALIAEVSSDKVRELGIQWQGISAGGRSAIVAGTNFSTGGNNIVDLTASALTGGATAAGVLPGSGFNLGILNRVNLPGGGQAVNLSLLAHALENDGVTNVLSTPNLLTLDNEEARIVVGQNVPFITGQYAQTGTAVTPTPFQTIERRDVGISLKVKPQITEGGTVRLQVSQEVSSVDASQTNTSGIITNKRSVDSTVLLADGQTIVLGGLIQDAINDGQEKVPVLGDIPVLGGLFSYSTKRRTKTNLMVFLRPTIVRDGKVPAHIATDRYNYILGEQAKQPGASAGVPAFAPTPAPPAGAVAAPVPPN